MDHLIYLNHAGTSWPKPGVVRHAAAAVFQASPKDWPELFADSHSAIAAHYATPADRLLLTPSCTAALSLAIADLPWLAGERIITSSFEHHALQRCVEKLAGVGVESTRLPPAEHALFDLDALQQELQRGHVRLLAFTAACNVTGLLAPIEEAVALANDYGVSTMIDGAQVAGWKSYDFVGLGASFFTVAAHKGPQAPWGAGALYVAPHVTMNCPLATCSATAIDEISLMPGYCDAGSANLAAIAGWAAACEWLQAPEREFRLNSAQQMAGQLATGLRDLPGVRLLHDVDAGQKMPTVAMLLEGQSSQEVAEALRSLGVIVSGGFQCAPMAHAQLGTESSGVVRFSLGPTTSTDDIAQTLERVTHLVTS